MAATLRLKQLLFIAAALALVSLGLVAALSPASPARADDTSPCVETDGSYTPWAQTGTIVQHGDATQPGTNTNLKEYRGPTATKHVTQEFKKGTPAEDSRVWWVFRGQNGDAAPGPLSDLWRAQPNLPAAQSQHSYPGENGLGNPYQPGADAGNGDWFRFTGVLIPAVQDTPEESHTDYTWTVWEREFVEGNTCPPVPCEQTNTCPPVPCEETDTCPPVENPPVCHPVEGKGELGNGWNLIGPDQASSHIDESKYPNGEYWMHETKDGRHDIYSTDGKTCPGAERHEVTPMAEGLPDDCDPDPFGTITVTAMEGVTYTLQDGSPVEGTIAANGTNTVTAHLAENYVLAEGAVSEWVFTSNPAVDCPAPPCEETQTCPEFCPDGTEVPSGEDPKEFCDDDEFCPDGTEVPGGQDAEEFCEEDPGPSPNCDDDPSLPGCDENKPPVVVPDDSSTPSSGPTVKGAQATAPTIKGAGAVAGTPAARVPTAIDAGLAPQQRDTGGGLGLLGIAAAFLGAALVGLTVRPRQRIGATARART